jgi:hypothetical protein
VTTESGFGSGFVVGRNLVATCFHVVRGSPSIRVATRDGTQHDVVSVVAYSASEDLAVLATNGLPAPALLLGDSTNVNPGDPVTVVGHPEGLENTVTSGIVSGTRLVGDTTLFQIDAAISHGSSGGPVFNELGQVIGVTHGFLSAGQSLNFATPSSGLVRLLRSQNPTALTAFAAATAELPSPSTPSPQTAPSAGGTFPTTVAGFSFGMTIQEIHAACPEARIEAERASCPHALIDVPFAAGRVTFLLSYGRITVVTLEARSREVATSLLSQKYGQYKSAKFVGGSWFRANDWSQHSAGGYEWDFAGGSMVLLNSVDGKNMHVRYVSAAYYSAQQRNY